MSGMLQMGLRWIIKTLARLSWRFIMQLHLDGLIGRYKMTENTGILNGTSGTIISNWVIVKALSSLTVNTEIHMFVHTHKGLSFSSILNV